MCMYVCIYIYIYREREGEGGRKRAREREREMTDTGGRPCKTQKTTVGSTLRIDKPRMNTPEGSDAYNFLADPRLTCTCHTVLTRVKEREHFWRGPLLTKVCGLRTCLVDSEVA